MPKNIQADIDWHRTRIAFYQQALDELNAAGAVPENTEPRQADIRNIIADLQHTLRDLEKALAHKS